MIRKAQEQESSPENNPSSLEAYFVPYRKSIVGGNSSFHTTYGTFPIVYADWIASGRLHRWVEDAMIYKVGPMVANTHSFSSQTGKVSTYAYRHARGIIKSHVNASEEDALVTTGTGMTGALVRLQRIMGLRYPEVVREKLDIPERNRPVVFISHMEHHSNQVSWMETIADVVIVPAGKDKLFSLENLEELLQRYKDRAIKIGAFTACSNVTGIITPIHQMAKVMHRHGGFCIADFAASAPYVEINMHPEDFVERLDAVVFSPHKFLGGPGSCGVLVFHRSMYASSVPDVPGGGNVLWTDPDGHFGYNQDIEVREDGGTPGFLQAIRAALSIRLKEAMGVDRIKERETELLGLCFKRLSKIKQVQILGDIQVDRIGCVSFVVEGIHYNLMVRLLNDRFGVQVRGGWSCASTYAHSLFDIDGTASHLIVQGIEKKDLSNKPGWVRLSLHPVMSNEELDYICDAIHQTIENVGQWQKDYKYDPATNEFDHLVHEDAFLIKEVKGWFSLK
ncbi:aminotransferase class V-fold PLP-dependent enzyme [Maribacter sp. X9]|uniref:aminotransferase class V-fold PLP-dependent enzyme n=1 Tax=Maribacter sp. X9 TaxID=3402159 RepID=UPI003AF36459